MSFFDALSISASGLTAQRLRMDVISENLANVNTTRAEGGKPYQRKIALFQEKGQNLPFSAYFSEALGNPGAGKGVRVSRVVNDETPGAKVYEPSHPDADADGYVTMPNVNMVTEMVNMISASRSYEANVTAINISKAIMAKTLEISR